MALSCGRQAGRQASKQADGRAGGWMRGREIETERERTVASNYRPVVALLAAKGCAAARPRFLGKPPLLARAFTQFSLTVALTAARRPRSRCECVHVDSNHSTHIYITRTHTHTSISLATSSSFSPPLAEDYSSLRSSLTLSCPVRVYTQESRHYTTGTTYAFRSIAGMLRLPRE